MSGPKSPPHQAASAVSSAIAGLVAAEGLDLEDVTVGRAGGRRLVRILVDADGGVTLDAVAALSTAVSEVLDASGVLGDTGYVLDVGSPGVDRPLHLTRHWRRNIGRLVRVTATDGTSSTGRIAAVDGPADDEPPVEVTLVQDGSPLRVSASTIRRAVVQVEFGDGQSLED